MKTYISKNIILIGALSLVSTIIYSILIYSSSIEFLSMIIIFFISALLFWTLIFELIAKEHIAIVILCAFLSITFVVLKGQFENEYMIFINHLVLNILRFYVLLGGIYFVIKDFVSVKINLIFLPLFLIFYVYAVYTMV